MKVEYIEWTDAIENLNGWHELDEALEWGREDDWIVREVGCVLKETKDYILMAVKKTKPSKGREAQYGQLFKIPKPWIVKRINLTKHIK